MGLWVGRSMIVGGALLTVAGFSLFMGESRLVLWIMAMGLMIMGAVVSSAGVIVVSLGRMGGRDVPASEHTGPHSTPSTGAPVLPRGGEREVRPGIWVGIAQVGAAVAIIPFGASTPLLIAWSLFGLLPSGAMFIVFSWRAVDGRLLTLRYRLVAAAAPLALMLVVSAASAPLAR